MHGIVNKAIQGLVTENYGEEIWTKVKEKSGVTIDFFVTHDPYDDAITYKLAGAAAEVLEVPLKTVLENFGEYWVLKTGQLHYGQLMKSGGKTFSEFLINLPNFHNRVMLMYPNITPPEFKISDIKENNLSLHYYSTREGLADFVTGLIFGLGKMFNEQVEVEIIKSRENGDDHEVYQIKW